MLRASSKGWIIKFSYYEIHARTAGIAADRCGGGWAPRHTFWMQNKADVTGLPIDGGWEAHLSVRHIAGIGWSLSNEQDAFERVYKPGRTYSLTQVWHPNIEWYQIYKHFTRSLKPSI